MAENLRFLLDLDNDVHYTESLVTLNSDRYIWYRLRRAGMDRNILFLRDGETGAPVFRVCDDDSRSRLLQFARRWILSNISETKKEYTPQDLNRSMDDLMAHLLKKKDEKITLVLTYDIWKQICKSANDTVSNLLKDTLKGRKNGVSFVIRLPHRAEELERCVCGEESDCEVLNISRNELRAICEQDPEHMMKALERLGSRFLRLDNDPVEMKNLLMQLAVREPDFCEDWKSLVDQAGYLELCRTLRFGLLSSVPSERFTPVSREEIGKRMKNADFRRELRERVRKLRERCPEGDIREALCREHYLPEPPPFPVYQDELALLVMSLTIDDGFLEARRGEKHDRINWSLELDAIKRKLTVLHNRPRNADVIAIAKKLCIKAHAANEQKNWKAYTRILELLKFYAEQICAPAELTKALKYLWENHGELLIELCVDVHRRERYPECGGLSKIANSALDESDRNTMEILSEIVNRTIRYFNRPKLSEGVIETIETKMEEDWVVAQNAVREHEAMMEAYHDQLNRLTGQTVAAVCEDPFRNQEEALFAEPCPSLYPGGKMDIQPAVREEKTTVPDQEETLFGSQAYIQYLE